MLRLTYGVVAIGCLGDSTQEVASLSSHHSGGEGMAAEWNSIALSGSGDPASRAV